LAGTFSDSMRSLSRDRFRPFALGLLVAVLILAAWIAWFLLARVSLYESSDRARLEVETTVHTIAAPVQGRILVTGIAVGREVQAGELLVELESQSERLRVDEAKAQLAALAPQLAALRDEVKAEAAARHEQLSASQIAIEQARKQYEEADASVRLAREEAERFTKLNASGLLSDIELSRARTEVEKQRASADALQLQIAKQQVDLRNKQSDSQVRIERLNREIASVESQAATLTATVSRLEYDIERHRIRAPIAGRVAEAAQLQAGAVVNAGDKLGAIVPAGQLKVVAYFRPSAALGRIRAGQPARLRLEGFPWTQYGSLGAVVETIAAEPRDGQIRVDLTLKQDQASAIPFQHGLPGAVEIEVDRVSPATLLLRSIGKPVDPPAKAQLAQ
jgi:multidrug resistance efflux pump